MQGHEHYHGGIKGGSLLFVIIFNLIITAAEAAGGLISGSYALLSDALHNFTDVWSIVLSYAAIRIKAREKNEKSTFGYGRIEVIAAFMNTSALIIAAAFLLFEGIRRSLHPEPVRAGLMIAIAVIGLFGNLFSILILGKHAREGMNIRSAFLHLLADTLSSVAVVLGGVLIKIFGIIAIDGIMAIGISFFIFIEAAGIFRQAFNILMQSAPVGISIADIRSDIEALPQVKEMHHIHLWQLDDERIFLEAHIEADCDITLLESNGIRKAAGKILKNKYGISHITLQIEYGPCPDRSGSGTDAAPS